MRVRKGFTLAELLVVIGIIAVLISILLPVLHRVREQANRVVCASNEKQIYASLLMYCQDNKGVMPVPGAYGAPIYPNLAIVQDDIGWYSYTRGVLWSDLRGGVDSRQKLFLCPSDGPDRQVIIDVNRQVPDPTKRRNFSYNFNKRMEGAGGPPVMTDQGVVTGRTGVRLGQITGQDHKLLVVEGDKPRDSAQFLTGSDDSGRLVPGLATRHSGRGNQCFADGHVELFGDQDMPNITLIKHYVVLTPMQGGYLP